MRTPYVFPCTSKAESMYKYLINIKFNVIFSPKFYALQDGALGFPVSSVLYAENAS
jgi:hypothetical protein